MTCIVGLAHEGGVLLGGDSAGVSNLNLQIRIDRKVFRIGDQFVIGFTDSFRMGQLLAVKLAPPKYHPDTDPWHYMVGEFVEAVRCCLADGGYARKDSNVETGGQFLVGFQRRLFTVHSDFQVGERADGINAIGCGADFALGSLAETEGREPIERVTRALAAAERFSAGVRSPFQFEALSSQAWP